MSDEQSLIVGLKKRQRERGREREREKVLHCFLIIYNNQLTKSKRFKLGSCVNISGGIKRRRRYDKCKQPVSFA